MEETEVTLGILTDTSFVPTQQGNEREILQQIEKTWSEQDRTSVMNGEERVSCLNCWKLEKKKGKEKSDDWEDYAYMSFVKKLSVKEKVITPSGRARMEVSGYEVLYECPVCLAKKSIFIDFSDDELKILEQKKMESRNEREVKEKWK